MKLQSTAAYSADGDHVTRVRNANNQLVEYAYNTADERLTSSTVMVTDSSGQEVIHSTSAYTYDNAGRITKTTLSNTSSELASISYSYPDGRLSSLARTSKRSGASQIQTYNFTYNAWGQSTAVKVGSTTLATYEYEKIGNSTNSADGGGNLTKMTYGNNQSVSYSYDSLDRLIKKTYNDTGSYVEYAYNSEGALARVSSYDSDNDLLAVYVFEYDGLGRLIRSAEYDGDNALVQRTEHIYDAYNRLSSQSWVIGNTSYSESYTYDDGASGDGSLTKMTTATGDTLNYTYDALKRLNNVTTKNASGTALFSTSYAFRNLSTTSGITQTTTQVQYRNVRIGTNGTILEGKKYSYDDVGNITKISQSTSPYNPLVVYEYDSQNQLTKETYYDGAGSETDNITKTIAYTYDTVGNILSETKTVGTTTTTKSYTYSTGNWKDLLKSVTVNGTNYSISSSGGNPTNWYNGSKTYTGLTWQQGRQLAGLTVGETSVSYEYDADGIRTKMVAGDVTYEFVTQGGKLMRETATNSSAVYVMDFIYDNVGRPFAVKFSKNGGSSFTTFYYVLNLQGDVVAITKADGTVVAKYTYDAWGNLTSLINANGTEIVNRTTGTAIAFWNPLTYRGYIRDRETGFYYLQSRYYDPANHRFINADGYTSTGQGFAGTNMFAYCGNNPVSRIDSTGQFWNEIWGFVQNVVLEVGNAIKEFIPQYVGCGALALLDGPVPVLDVFAIAGAAIITVGAIGYGVYRAIQTPAKSTLKAEEKEKDITLPPFPTVIYRYGGTNPGNLTPKEKDKFTGLSFSTVPMPGAAMTTIEALNATGLVYAVRDGATHVSVRPIGGTMDDWINAGSSSVWTQAVKSVVIKIK